MGQNKKILIYLNNDFMLQWTPATLGTCQSVLIRGVASFQGSRLEGVHCICIIERAVNYKNINQLEQ